jgi:hypothetical protein
MLRSKGRTELPHSVKSVGCNERSELRRYDHPAQFATLIAPLDSSVQQRTVSRLAAALAPSTLGCASVA